MAAEKIELMIEAEMVEFNQWMNMLGVVPVISALREKALGIQAETMVSLQRKLPHLSERDIKVLNKHTKSIINQMLKDPILYAKELADEPNTKEALNEFVKTFRLEELIEKQLAVSRAERLSSGEQKQLGLQSNSCASKLRAIMELIMTRLHEATVILYALSVLLYFIDFLYSNQKANKLAFWLLSIVWLLQTIFLCLYVIKTGRFPVLTIFEGLYFYTWVLITLSLFINRLLRVDFTVFFTNVLGFMVMAIHTFAPVQIESKVLAEKLVSELSIIHITLAILSYGAFTISFVFSHSLSDSI